MYLVSNKNVIYHFSVPNFRNFNTKLVDALAAWHKGRYLPARLYGVIYQKVTLTNHSINQSARPATHRLNALHPQTLD